MTAPTLEQTRAAVASLQSLSPPEFFSRKSAEVGDALVAFFVILAKRLFPQDPESATAMRVNLMLASYFLGGDLAGRPGTAPSEEAARKAVEKVASLGGAALDRRIADEIGDSVLSFFQAFAGKLKPERDPDAATKNVHLMILAFLARAELAKEG